jgi:hypothetical protein
MKDQGEIKSFEELMGRDPEKPLIERLMKFTRKVIADACWGYSTMDGCDIQELAEKLGLIVPHIATEEDVDDRSDFEIGDRIYKFAKGIDNG